MSENINADQNLMAELASRLQQLEERAITVISTLEKQVPIQDEINIASKGLTEANSVVTELATATKEATKEFRGAVLALQEVANILQKTDLGALHSRFDALTQQIKQLREVTESGHAQLRDEINTSAQKITGQIEPQIERVKENCQDIQKGISKSTDSVASRLETECKKLREHTDAENISLRKSINASAGQVLAKIEPQIGQVKESISRSTDSVVSRLKTECKQLREGIDAGFSPLKESIETTEESIVKRLRPRNVKEGMFGRRSDY